MLGLARDERPEYGDWGGGPIARVTPVATPYVWEPLGPDGVARIMYMPGAIVTEELARRTIAELLALTSGERVVLLADIRNMKSITREARVFYGNAAEAFSALALLAGSPTTQLIANFFIGLSHPKVPTQMFTEKEKALTWLRRHTA